MNETIRETDNFEFFKCIHNGITAILDKKTCKLSDWNTGSVEVRDEINHIKHLDDKEFDKYCKGIEKS